MHDVKFRLVNPGLQPRRTKLEMPGWAGQPEPRTDGSQEYAWHCAPFTEGAQYGIEIFYPYANELHVSKKDGKLIFDGDFGPPPDDTDLMWPPFRSFGQDYYSYQLLLDLKVGKDWAVRTEPHPRFYTDPTDTVPLAVPESFCVPPLSVVARAVPPAETFCDPASSTVAVAVPPEKTTWVPPLTIAALAVPPENTFWTPP